MSRYFSRAAIGGLAIAALAWAAPVYAAGSGGGSGSDASSSSGSSKKIDSQSKSFLQKISSPNQAEIRASEMAARNAQTPAVRKLAAQVAQEQQRIASSGRSLAAEFGVNAEKSDNGNGGGKFNNLSSQRGIKFDQQYLSDLTGSLKNQINNFQDEVTSTGSNPRLREYANRNLEVLRGHLIEAQTLQNQLQNSGSSNSSGSNGSSSGSSSRSNSGSHRGSGMSSGGGSNQSGGNSGSGGHR